MRDFLDRLNTEAEPDPELTMFERKLAHWPAIDADSPDWTADLISYTLGG